MPLKGSDNGRIDFRIAPEPKAVISALRDAQAVIERAEHLALSERGSLRILELLENPPSPTNRLIRAAKAGQTLA